MEPGHFRCLTALHAAACRIQACTFRTPTAQRTWPYNLIEPDCMPRNMMSHAVNLQLCVLSEHGSRQKTG